MAANGSFFVIISGVNNEKATINELELLSSLNFQLFLSSLKLPPHPRDFMVCLFAAPAVSSYWLNYGTYTHYCTLYTCHNLITTLQFCFCIKQWQWQENDTHKYTFIIYAEIWLIKALHFFAFLAKNVIVKMLHWSNFLTSTEDLPAIITTHSC